MHRRRRVTRGVRRIKGGDERAGASSPHRGWAKRRGAAGASTSRHPRRDRTSANASDTRHTVRHSFRTASTRRRPSGGAWTVTWCAAVTTARRHPPTPPPPHPTGDHASLRGAGSGLLARRSIARLDKHPVALSGAPMKNGTTLSGSSADVSSVTGTVSSARKMHPTGPATFEGFCDDGTNGKTDGRASRRKGEAGEGGERGE